MKRYARRDRATIGVMGMSAIAFVLAMLTGAVLMRSLDSYKASADLESRLQARAAAEGAVVALLRAQGKPPSQPLEIGPARVSFVTQDAESAAADSAASPVRFVVEVARQGRQRPVLSLLYQVRLGALPEGGLSAQRLEVVR